MKGNIYKQKIYSASVFIDDQGQWSIVVETDSGIRAFVGDEAKRIAAFCQALCIPINFRTSINPSIGLAKIKEKIKAEKEKDDQEATNKVKGGPKL